MPFDIDIPITYNDRGPYDIALVGHYPEDPGSGEGDSLAVDKWGYGRGLCDSPYCTVDSVTTSTSTSGIELAYGDNATIHWRKNYCEFHAQSIVVLQEDSSGTIVDPNNPNLKYKIIATAPLADSTNVVEHNAQTYNWYITGDLTWPTPGTHMPEFPSGHHRLGVKFDDEYISLTGQYIDVCLSIYDAYTGNTAPLYVGDGTTTVYYKLSSQAMNDADHKPRINIGNVATVFGTSNVGSNTSDPSHPWNGTDASHHFVSGGSYGLTFNVTPLSGSVGPLLQINNIYNDGSFIPASNETLTIGFDIHEPVRRPQSTQAKLTAVVYNSNGEFVKLLANKQQANIDNQAEGHSDGHNELVWDGKDEQGQIVDAGSYTITLFAKDNAGVGCDSNCMITTVDVADLPQSEADLEWPGGDLASGEEDPNIIAGYTDSDSYSVDYSIDNGQSQTASVDQSTGMFSIDVSGFTGLHTATIHTTDSRYGEKTISISFFRNSLSITTPQNWARFDPQSNGNITLQYTSQASDTVDVHVVDPYDQSACISWQQPVPAAEVMNGTVSDKTIKVLATGQSVVAGTNTITWDGKDTNGAFVSPGVYNVVIQRSNTDGLFDTDTVAQIVVEHPTGAPQISGVTTSVEGASIALSWSTDIATTGYIICESDDDARPIFRVPAGSASTNHTVWLPGMRPGTTYNYYVIATNPTTGASAISDRRAVIAGNGPAVGNISLILAGTQVQVSYSSEPLATAAIEYAQVGPGISPIQWQRAEHAYKDTEHQFTLSDLQPNSEYVYRIVSATDDTWANSTKSEFRWFTTKTDLSTVTFTDIEDRAGVSAITDITVTASDAAHRFSAHGITKVELYIDGVMVESFDKTATGDHVDYTFHAGAMNLTDGVHQIEAVAYDDFWKETHKRIQVLLDSGGSGVQSMAVSSRVGILSTQSQWPSALGQEWRKAQVIPNIAKLSYIAGPRYFRGRDHGSQGTLSLDVLAPVGGEVFPGIPDPSYQWFHFRWPASSGASMNWHCDTGTMPPGIWHTAGHHRVSGNVEGVPDGHYGAYLIHPYADKVKPWPLGRNRDAFHIHGNWVHNDSATEHGVHNGEMYYYTSHGCIILHREDLAPSAILPINPKTLADCWKKYVLNGEEHGGSSVGVPLRVEYNNK